MKTNFENRHVISVDDVRLRVIEESWPFAETNCDSIEYHWKNATADNPLLFDGGVFVITGWRVADGVLSGTAVPTRFAAYHYWRSIGFDGGVTTEAFATTILRASDGAILLARAVAGTLNGGRYVAPGGLLDHRDVTGNGCLDLAGAAERELREETGFSAQLLSRAPGFLVLPVLPFIAIASVFDAPFAGPELLARTNAFLASQAAPELQEPCLIYRIADLDELPLTDFTRLLTASVLAY